MPPILLGTSISGRGGAAGREAAAQASLQRLTASGAALCVNLGFPDDSPQLGALETLRLLQHDARTVTGVNGGRKPLVDEMIDALAAEADRRGLSRIGIVNGDIVVTPEALEEARRAPAAAFSRTDTGGGEPEALLLYGVDMVIFEAAYWRKHRHRFRAYILGEPVWDNVYAAIVVSHGGVLLNRQRLILHERHPSATADSPYRRYTQLLAARDSSYFSNWCVYVSRAEALRAGGGTPEQEYALQRATLTPPGLAAGAVDAMRGSWWRMKQAFGA